MGYLSTPAKSKISVVVPFFNEADNLPRLLESLKNQTVLPFETIFVDNNSTDQSRAIVEAAIGKYGLAGRVVTESQRGIPFGRNRGIMEARGEVVAFLDADCVAPRNYIETLQHDFEMYPVHAVCGRYRLRGDDATKAKYRGAAWSEHFGWDNPKRIIKKMQNQVGTLVSGCSAIRKSVFFNLGMYDERFLYMDDVAFSVRFYRVNYVSLYDPNLVVDHVIETRESVIAKKDWRYGHDQALINKYLKRRRIGFSLNQFWRLVRSCLGLLRPNGYEFYKFRTLIYFKLGMFVTGIKKGCLYL